MVGTLEWVGVGVWVCGCGCGCGGGATQARHTPVHDLSSALTAPAWTAHDVDAPARA